jgi:8-amino-7-oxononanoate synthase
MGPTAMAQLPEATKPVTAHARALDALARRGRLRSLSPRAGCDFTSNDYLGLAASPELAAAAQDAIARGVPIGAGGSRLLRGNHEEHERLEAAAATFFSSEAALYFGGGFAANAALIATLPARGDLIVHDALVHASAWEGMAQTKATCVSAAHNEPQAFEDAIAAWRAAGGVGRVWLAVESLYSMDGDRAPLADLAEIARRHDAMMLIDEAHATGVLGPGGRGLGAGLEGCEHVVTLHTCGKALGASGALITCSASIRDFLINRARAFIYATAPSPVMAAVVHRALQIVDAEPERRVHLAARVEFAAVRLSSLCGMTASGSHIMPVIVGSDARAVAAAQAMQAAGFDVRAIRPPTVPEGTARLRITLTLNTSEAETGAMIDALADVLRGSKTRTSGEGCLGPGLRRDDGVTVDGAAPEANLRTGSAPRFVITGTGTDVGKTVFAAALVEALDGEYWKPVQAGLLPMTDTERVRLLSGLSADRLHAEPYRLTEPASPHYAARLEGVMIDPDRLVPPVTTRPLVIEGAGGLMVPLTDETLAIDVFARWKLPVILVASTALGTINHTLLSVEALRARGIPIHGIAFVGDAAEASEAIICAKGRVRRLGRLPILPTLTSETLAAAFSANFNVADFVGGPRS